MLNIPKKTLAVIAKCILTVLGVLHLSSANRIVIALSPLFTTAAGALTALLAHYLPVIGSHFTTPELTGLFFSGGLFAASHLLLWLKGWQNAEAKPVTPTLKAAALAPAPAPQPIVVNVHTAAGADPTKVAQQVAGKLETFVAKGAKVSVAEPAPADEPAPLAPAPEAESLEGHTEVPPPAPGVVAPEQEVGRL